MKPVAIIPARGGSKRIPRKNIAEVCGKPMIAWPIENALRTGLFERVIVSTDDDAIADIARSYNADVSVRPDELATDTAEEIYAYKHVLEELGDIPDYFCAIYPTAILLTPDDLTQAFDQFDERTDVVMGVSEYALHPYKALQQEDGGFLSMVHPYECNNLRSQDYPYYVASSGTFYWFKSSSFLQDPNYFPEKLRGHVVPRDRAVDIDVPDDLKLARILKQSQLKA